MSFSTENFQKKLGSLQETQDSIVSISQWVLFHHRHSTEIAKVWSDFIKSTSNSKKRLSLLYLCNDVVQQARHKRKPEFISAFADVLPMVFQEIFYQIDPPIKPKIERLVRVWDERLIFSKQDLLKMKKGLTSSSPGQEDDNMTAESKPSKATVNIVPELRSINTLLEHLTRAIDTSQNELNQVGIQSKTYLPGDPSVSDSLPAPRIYIEKLNQLEKICQTSNSHIEGIMRERQAIVTALRSLAKVVEDGMKTDETKKMIINSKLTSLHETRNQLIELVKEEGGNDSEYQPQKSIESDTETLVSLPSIPSVPDTPRSNTEDADDDDEDDDDMLPTYDNDSDSDEEDSKPRIPEKPEIKMPPSKRFKPKSKSVAFSENVEIKEYDRENQTEIIKIIKSDDDQTEVEDEDDYDGGLSDEYSSHHKDLVELKHEEEGYDPSASNGSSVLDLLSKLQ